MPSWVAFTYGTSCKCQADVEHGTDLVGLPMLSQGRVADLEPSRSRVGRRVFYWQTEGDALFAPSRVGDQAFVAED